ncbi:hypothetical protein [Lentzea aerocolonigenes]|nr:hypothetical protein [Lentzea aerocolonigenes]
MTNLDDNGARTLLAERRARGCREGKAPLVHRATLSDDTLENRNPRS